MFTPASIIYAWDNQLGYALALLDDLTDEQFVLRPGGKMNHPAWIVGHIAAYHPVIGQLLRGEPVADPKDDPLFGFAGHGPLEDIGPYGSKQAMVERFAKGHEEVAQALLAAQPTDFTRPPSLERWEKQYPTVEFMLPDLLLHHESLHIGQISIWRRAAGLPAVKLPSRTIRAGLLEKKERPAAHTPRALVRLRLVRSTRRPDSQSTTESVRSPSELAASHGAVVENIA